MVIEKSKPLFSVGWNVNQYNYNVNQMKIPLKKPEKYKFHFI